jgi:multisubunit Na+/H+ antiporter MnhE subunit
VPGSSRDETQKPRWDRAAAAGLEILWWWAAAVAIWALTLSSVPPQELIAAAICGLPCAVAARAGRKAVSGGWHPRLRWTAWLLPLLLAVPADAMRLLIGTVRWLISRQEPGELQDYAMPAGEPPDVAAARHAMAVLTISATPGTFVADSDPEEDKIVIHTLVSGPPHLERVVRQ